jgi:saccharopine dehydrogenase-like NADP-dependent oxidoreductase
MDLYHTLIEAGCGSPEQFRLTEKISMPVREFTVRLVRAMPRFAPAYFSDILREAMDEYKGVAGAFKIDVAGKQAGENVRYIYDIAAESVTRGTAMPAAIATLMLLEGQVTSTGVLPPEGALDAGMFYTELAGEARTREIEIREKVFTKNLFRKRA